MNKETRTMQTAGTTPARAPEDAPALVKKIGKTTYKVRVHFSDTSTETMSDKIKRIYAVLIRNISGAADIAGAIWGCMGYTVLLCFCLFKTGSISKSVFGAH